MYQRVLCQIKMVGLSHQSLGVVQHQSLPAVAGVQTNLPPFYEAVGLWTRMNAS